ncbi:MAG: hypothetical protein E7304_05020 [Butyrivibrio sp.]|jgi:hypothetical protein|uniref:hypothetical protein n=1 Tax=Butyrivibrio sp. TaxID=28121 RepID=UPI001ED41190|nr:hypothetical protein [Butyrivibrio sp.]MBE5840751.1 hypothetical protein [Butyrivibrio sp.]
MRNKIFITFFVVSVFAVIVAACGDRKKETYDVSDLEATTLTSQAIVEAKEEASATEASAYNEMLKEHVPMDISGCDTFTQIVDKLSPGMAYANARIGDTDVLLVTEYTYDYKMDNSGNMAAIDAEIYKYNEAGTPEYVGYITAGGTAYPLSVKDDFLYVGGNHFIKKYTMKAGHLEIDEEAFVEYQSNGDAQYYHRSDYREVEADENGQVDSDSFMTSIYAETEDAEIIDFSVVQ